MESPIILIFMYEVASQWNRRFVRIVCISQNYIFSVFFILMIRIIIIIMHFSQIMNLIYWCLWRNDEYDNIIHIWIWEAHTHYTHNELERCSPCSDLECIYCSVAWLRPFCSDLHLRSTQFLRCHAIISNKSIDMSMQKSDAQRPRSIEHDWRSTQCTRVSLNPITTTERTT